tara:strand:- start:159351 stop:159719 length:369 start_codon:yes stop_codon:yes gene_type:complete
MKQAQYTEAEINQAWKCAPPAAGYPASMARADRYSSRTERIICRNEFGRKTRNGWTIDERGRARAYRYKFLEEKAAKELKEEAERLAEEAGMPDATALFRRILTLEDRLQSQQFLIDSLIIK